MRKIKVLFIGMSDNLGGIEVFGKDLILNSDPKKIEFMLLVKKGITVPFQDELETHGVKILEFHSRKKHYRRFLSDLKSVFQNNKFDVVHINVMDYSLYEIIKYACKYSGSKVVVHSHNGGFKNKSWKYKLLDYFGKRALRNFEFNRIACTEEAGNYLFGDKPFEIFRNGIDFERFEFSRRARNEIRKELGISKDTYIIGNVASFTSPKNHEFLVKVFGKLKGICPDIKMLLVGVGKDMRKIRKMVAQLGLSDDVLFLGKRTDVNKVYSAMDVFAMPSISEGMSIALCEAQVNGLKCFASKGVGKDSDISGNVKFMNINYANKWANLISKNLKHRRKNKVKLSQEVSVKNTAQALYNYYDKLVGKKTYKNDRKISVVVPCYNAFNTIGRCFNSILSQDYKNIELIVVDDGSTDLSLKIIKNYMAKDNRIKLICQNHGGPNAARGLGVQKATGDYIMFVDSDDFIDDNAISILVEAVDGGNVDIVRFGAAYFSTGKELASISLPSGKQNVILSRDYTMKLLLTTYKLNSLCLQLYKAEVIKNNLAFNYDVVFGEDFLVNLEINKEARKVLLIDNILYYYCDNSNSTTRNHDREKIIKNILDRIFVSRKAIEVYSDSKIKTISAEDVVDAQLKMIRESVMSLAKVDGYKKKDFCDDFQYVLNTTDFNGYLCGLGASEKIKHDRLFSAFLKSDERYFWRYICKYKIYSILRHRGRY